MTNAAKVNSFFRQEKKVGKTYTAQQKSKVIESVVGLSQNKCERVLLALAPEFIPVEKVRPLTDTKSELKLVVDENTLDLLDRLKELLSNQMIRNQFLRAHGINPSYCNRAKKLGASFSEKKPPRVSSASPSEVFSPAASLAAFWRDFVYEGFMPWALSLATKN